MKKKDLLIELSLPWALGLMAIFFYVKACSIKPASAALFPKIICGVMLIGVVVTTIETLTKKKVTVHFEGLKPWKALMLLAMLVVYVLLLPVIGYIIPTLVLCIAIMWLLNYHKVPVVLLSSVIGTAAVFVIFKIVLKVPLPMLFLNI